MCVSGKYLRCLCYPFRDKAWVVLLCTSDPSRFRTGAMPKWKCFSTILCMLYTYKSSFSTTLSIKKRYQNLLGLFIDLSGKRLCFILCYDIYSKFKNTLFCLGMFTHTYELQNSVYSVNIQCLGTSVGYNCVVA
jgi:hypothetical protein